MTDQSTLIPGSIDLISGMPVSEVFMQSMKLPNVTRNYAEVCTCIVTSTIRQYFQHERCISIVIVKCRYPLCIKIKYQLIYSNINNDMIVYVLHASRSCMSISSATYIDVSKHVIDYLYRNLYINI